MSLYQMSHDSKVFFLNSIKRLCLLQQCYSATAVKDGILPGADWCLDRPKIANENVAFSYKIELQVRRFLNWP